MSIRDLARQRLAASEIQRAFHVSPSTDETLKHPKGDALAAETSFGKHQHNPVFQVFQAMKHMRNAAHLRQLS